MSNPQNPIVKLKELASNVTGMLQNGQKEKGTEVQRPPITGGTIYFQEARSFTSQTPQEKLPPKPTLQVLPSNPPLEVVREFIGQQIEQQKAKTPSNPSAEALHPSFQKPKETGEQPSLKPAMVTAILRKKAA